MEKLLENQKIKLRKHSVPLLPVLKKKSEVKFFIKPERKKLPVYKDALIRLLEKTSYKTRLFILICLLSAAAGAFVFLMHSFYFDPFKLLLSSEDTVSILIEEQLSVNTEEGSNAPEDYRKLLTMLNSTVRDYTVKSGDSVSKIASMFGISQSTLISVNNIKDARYLKPGISLKIPSSDGMYYKVKTGDTLEKISRSFNVPLNSILDINNISSSIIKAGEMLFIPGAKMNNIDLKRALGKLFIYPAQGRLTSPFGKRPDPFTGVSVMHWGIDIANTTGTPIFASLDGKVVLTSESILYGKFIVINHEGSYQTLYAHLDKILVKKDERVSQGQKIGEMGNTGRSTGSHLHFSLYYKQKPVDPLKELSGGN